MAEFPEIDILFEFEFPMSSVWKAVERQRIQLLWPKLIDV